MLAALEKVHRPCIIRIHPGTIPWHCREQLEHLHRQATTKMKMQMRSSLAARMGEQRDTPCSIQYDTHRTRNTNGRASVTKAQQTKILLACAIQAFWVVGINQSFGIFQAHYGSEKAFNDGIIRREDQIQRAGIAAIQALGNGGIVAVFAIFFFPRLPLIGKHIRTLCYGGAVFTTLGFAMATMCTNVSRSSPLSARTDDKERFGFFF